MNEWEALAERLRPVDGQRVVLDMSVFPGWKSRAVSKEFLEDNLVRTFVARQAAVVCKYPKVRVDVIGAQNLTYEAVCEFYDYIRGSPARECKALLGGSRICQVRYTDRQVVFLVLTDGGFEFRTVSARVPEDRRIEDEDQHNARMSSLRG